MRIYDCLGQGRENARSTRILMQMAGCRSVRELRRRVQRERLEGFLILSCEAGLYRPAEGQKGRREALESLRFMEFKPKSSLASLRHIRRFAEGVDGQLTIDEAEKGE